jgi:hypothetical protein
MAFSGSGVFNRLYNFVSDRNAAIKIRADRMDAEMDGFATGLSTCITKDGQTTITQDIPFNNKKITGLADATAANDAMNRQASDARYLARAGVADGTNAAPSITFAADTDTGIFRSDTNGLAITTSGLTRVEVTAGSGEPLVQISGSLSVSDGTAGNPSLTFFNSPSMGFYRISSTVLGISTAGFERVRVTEGGGQSVVQVSGQMGVDDGTVSYPGLGFKNEITSGIWRPAGSQMAFSVSGAEQMRIISNAVNFGLASALNVSTGSTDGVSIYSAGILAASANDTAIGAFRRRSSDGAVMNFFRDTSLVGSISVSGSATQFNTSSDYRLKTDVEAVPAEASRARLAKVIPRAFTWKGNGERIGGFIAHEFAEAYPASVVGEKDGEAMQQMSAATPEIIADIINDLNAIHARLDALARLITKG